MIVRGNCHGEDTADGTDGAVQRKLAQNRALRNGIRVHALFACQDGNGDRQIKRRAFFFDVGGREIDRNAIVREGETAVFDGGADAFSGFLDGGIGKADDFKHGKSVRHVDFDRNLNSVNAA